MENKEKFILNELSQLFENNNNIKLDTMMLYSILERNMENIDLILDLNDDEKIEMNAQELKEFVLDFKILKSVVQQMIHKNISVEEQEKIKKDYFINCQIEEDDHLPSISHLMSYNYFLENRPQLFNNKLDVFLNHLQSGNATAAKLSFEDLSFDQKQSVPENIQKWIQNYSHKF